MAQAAAEIIGTKQPQAAAIGAASGSPCRRPPPLECLSITGPGRSRSRHSSVRPERARPLSAPRAPPRSCRGRTPPWRRPRPAPRPRLPSVMPCVTNAISCSLSTAPSRFLRMISCGSMGSGQAFKERAQHTAHISRSSVRRGKASAHGSARRAPGPPRSWSSRTVPRLQARHGAPGSSPVRSTCDRVAAQRTRGADLGRRLEARAAEET